MKAATVMVIVDSAPVLAVSDTVSLAHASDVVLMVADVRRTDRGAVSAAAHMIQASGPPVVGVLNEERAGVNGWVTARVEREPEWSADRTLAVPDRQPSWRPDGNGNGQRPAAALGALPTLSYELTDTMPFRLTDPGADPKNG